MKNRTAFRTKPAFGYIFPSQIENCTVRLEYTSTQEKEVIKYSSEKIEKNLLVRSGYNCNWHRQSRRVVN